MLLKETTNIEYAERRKRWLKRLKSPMYNANILYPSKWTLQDDVPQEDGLQEYSGTFLDDSYEYDQHCSQVGRGVCQITDGKHQPLGR